MQLKNAVAIVHVMAGVYKLYVRYLEYGHRAREVGHTLPNE